MNVVKPNRVSRTETQRYSRDAAEVFPLLCPVREADWIEGWDPICVVTQSGLVESNCVFVTGAEPENAIWYVTRHEPDRGVLEMLKITPHVTACRITIAVHSTTTGSEALITYTHTSLGPAGDAFVASFTEEYYRQFMSDWEDQLNYYLAHGTARKTADARLASQQES